MKKSGFLSAGLFTAILLSVTGCTKFIDFKTPSEGIEYTISVSATDTKTVNDGLSTVWAQGDEISVFCTPANSSLYGGNARFTVSDLESGTFRGTLQNEPSPTASYDWYAIYPYTSAIGTPAAHSGSGAITVAANSQSQNGPDSRSHLAGDKMAAWAQAKSVSGSQKVNLKMHQLTGVIAVNVKNESGKSATISSVSLSADQNISGTYFVDITGGSPVYTPAQACKNATLSVSNAVLSAGSSAKFYLAVTPFTAASLKVSVNGKEKTFNFGKNIEFQAGHIKTINYTLEKDPVEEGWKRVTTLDQITSGGRFIIGYEASAKSGVIVPMRTECKDNIMYSGTTAGKSEKGTIDMATVTATSAYEVEFVKSTAVSGAVCIKVGDSYIGNENSKNSCKLYSTQSKTTSFTPTIGTNDVVTLKITSNSSYHTLQYNPSSPRFAVYGGSQKNLVLYKNGGGGGDDPVIPGEPSVSTGGSSAITTTSAVLSASYSNAPETPYSAYFLYGTSSSNLSKTAYCNEVISGASDSFTANLYNLSASTTYYYKAAISIGDKVYTGELKSFTTASNTPAGETTRGWAEMPAITDKDGNNIDDNNSTWYYAYHSFSGRRNYTVCFSSDHHCAMWVAAPRHSCYTGGSGRNDSYRADPDIPSGIQFKSKDTGGGCNKGHLLGSAERTCSVEANKQVFYYSNIAPQYSSGYNTGGGGWNTLEDYIDSQVCKDTLYEVIGCYYESFTDGYGYSASPKKISFGGRSDVSCPTMFYYAVLRTKKGNTGKSVKNCTADELQCVAFVRSHNNGLKGQKVSAKEMMSISDLEKLTGFKYFVNVPNAPKSTYNPNDWL